ncbi:hypothetical protein QC763_309260 [Podospora pseudopauciseta]|uniref:Peptidyl-tRNA hydrolase n=4 Tax=Podospora TaxID=5144 RepID=A0A090CNH6_PODAN|nr:hypothetical protein QC761_309260 [Podospora bellae-mahoneyi]KAK4667438.1 hypothetical protein QC763_309260 [Podospora pseudopauciseta]KAK4678614.1 hypothetical protein QC764_309260 [Podospora pseudoanserina]CDP27462.1 Putative protein of unknown function [Podospora anserina S mat+]
MRFSTATAALAALGPLSAAAAESPFEQYKAKFQNFLSSFSGSAGIPEAADNVQVPIPKPKSKTVEPKKIDTLTLANWKDTLYAPVHAEATIPEEWLVLITGGNKTCFGRCDKLDTAFSQSALKLASLKPTPDNLHLASVNCDDEPVLCNSWSASTGVIWLFEILPAPTETGLYVKRLNTTTVTSQDIVDAYVAPKEEWTKVESDSYFHPIDGFFAKNGLAVPLGWFFWGLNAVPSWVMMLGVSFVSRSMMNKRVEGMAGGPRAGAGAPAAAAPRGAAPGDARS